MKIEDLSIGDEIVWGGFIPEEWEGVYYEVTAIYTEGVELTLCQEETAEVTLPYIGETTNANSEYLENFLMRTV